jgi:demethylmenaquinone methyltransferase / 2-methoxy-6-polyprenyl-1,4-benzoquinol methylase
VLVPGGTSVILELSRPGIALIASLYDLYAVIGVRLLGRIISRHGSAYRYLPDSIRDFPEPREFLASMTSAGFTGTAAHPLTLGAATIYVGRKPGA